MIAAVSTPQAAGRSTPDSSYPARRSDWLHQFSSLLARADVARQIGRDAVLLLLSIAVQEDRQQYQSAPIFFITELQRMTGIRSVARLNQIIQIAVDAGWLMAVYPSSSDTSVGQYWTVIPQRLKVFETAPPIPADSTTQASPKVAIPQTPDSRNQAPALNTSLNSNRPDANTPQEVPTAVPPIIHAATGPEMPRRSPAATTATEAASPGETPKPGDGSTRSSPARTDQVINPATRISTASGPASTVRSPASPQDGNTIKRSLQT